MSQVPAVVPPGALAVVAGGATADGVEIDGAEVGKRHQELADGERADARSREDGDGVAADEDEVVDASARAGCASSAPGRPARRSRLHPAALSARALVDGLGGVALVAAAESTRPRRCGRDGLGALAWRRSRRRRGAAGRSRPARATRRTSRRSPAGRSAARAAGLRPGRAAPRTPRRRDAAGAQRVRARGSPVAAARARSPRRRWANSDTPRIGVLRRAMAARRSFQERGQTRGERAAGERRDDAPLLLERLEARPAAARELDGERLEEVSAAGGILDPTEEALVAQHEPGVAGDATPERGSPRSAAQRGGPRRRWRA